MCTWRGVCPILTGSPLLALNPLPLFLALTGTRTVTATATVIVIVTATVTEIETGTGTGIGAGTGAVGTVIMIATAAVTAAGRRFAAPPRPLFLLSRNRRGRTHALCQPCLAALKLRPSTQMLKLNAPAPSAASTFALSFFVPHRVATTTAPKP